MAQTIKIKRSTGSAAPSTLASGELAYSKGSDTFYIGDPSAANTPIAVGGAIKNNAGTAVLATGITAGEIRTLVDVDQAGTDNSTDVTLVTTSHDYLSISGQAVTLGAIDLAADVTGTLPVANGGTGATTAAGARTALGVDAAGTDNSTDVTLGASVTDILSLSGQAISGVDAGLADAVIGWDDSAGKLTYLAAADARTALGLGSLATLSAVGASEITDNSVGAAELNVSGNGTAGQALVSDGDGTMSWSTISVTDNDVNVANLTARLPQITESVTIGDATDVTITTSGNLVVTGDLTVSGTTTTVNTETINLADNLITLNSNYTGSTPTENGGIEVERGTLTNVALQWNETNDNWEFTNDGSTYQTVYSFDPDATAFNIGLSATSSGNTSTAVGRSSTATNTYTSAFGAFADATGTESTALGYNTTASNSQTVAVGANATAAGSESVAIGKNASAPLSGAGLQVAIGTAATASTSYGVAIGPNTDATGAVDLAIGYAAQATGSYSVAIGSTATSSGNSAIAIGNDAEATAANTLVVNASGAVKTYSTAGEVFIGTDDGQITYDATNGWQFVQDAGGTPTTYKFSDFGTGDGTVTSVGGTGTVNGISLSGTVTSSGNLTLGGSLSGITVSQLDGAAVQTAAEIAVSFGDNDTSLLTAAAVDDRILSYGYSTTTGTVTSVAVSSTDGSISGTGTITSSGTFDLEVATIDGGTY